MGDKDKVADIALRAHLTCRIRHVEIIFGDNVQNDKMHMSFFMKKYPMTQHEESDPFGDRLSQARELRRISQSDLSKKTSIQPSSLSHFEAGTRKPSFDNLLRIANALEVSTDFLLGRVLEPEMPSDRLHTEAQKLSDKDRELAEAFIKMLGDRADVK